MSSVRMRPLLAGLWRLCCRWIHYLLWIAVLTGTPGAGQSKVVEPLSEDEISSRFKPPSIVESEPPLRIGRQPQLLVDNHVLADWWRLRRLQYRVRKHPDNPILEPDQPWEETRP